MMTVLKKRQNREHNRNQNESMQNTSCSLNKNTQEQQPSRRIQHLGVVSKLRKQKTGKMVHYVHFSKKLHYIQK